VIAGGQSLQKNAATVAEMSTIKKLKTLFLHEFM